MVWLLITLLAFVLLVLVMVLTKLTVLIHYQHYNDNDNLTIEFRIWFGLIKYKKNIPLIKIDDDSPSIVVKSDSNLNKDDEKVQQISNKEVTGYWQRTHELLDRIFNLNLIIKKLLKKVMIKQLEWETFIGVGDAAHTGIAVGALWAAKGGIVGLLSKFLNLTVMPQLSITPHFQAAVIQTQLKCMFQFRIGHAILAGLKLIKFWRGEKKRSKNNANLSNEKIKSIS
ncbi:DUF2953 domain-containing protein [Neobacillus sp. LXY-1]|uniref:DUF2953 domain-containing protein n=1 Tax=Neobacillus sp. LXY-1 TaxID=3379133 RepID=UPI003EE312FE